MEATIYIHLFISFLSVFCMVFTVLLTFIYICQLIISFIRVFKNKKRMRSNDYKRYSLSKNLLPVSLIIPAYNEEKNIVSNIRALMKINYPKYEIIVVNDGSDDNTHSKIVSAFGLCKIDAAIKTSIPTKQVRGIYYNAEYPKLLYVDKENGGKSDALNAGINTSSYPLFAGLDADTCIEPDALLRICTEFLKNTDTAAAGGLVRISNGFRLKNGKAYGFSMPRKMIERFQIVEYCRSFFSGRVSWGALNSLLIISGAFSVFKKQTVIEVGGYNNDTVGEDMEIVVRLHWHMKESKRKYRIVFCEEAVCWTQGPMSVKDIKSQRRRWQIGLIDTLILHKSMFLRPKYGNVGIAAIPYNWIFEMFGAFVEAVGYFVIPISFIIGELNLFFFILYYLLSVLLGAVLSLGSLILEQYAGNTILNLKQYLSLSLYAVLENFGYRQAITVFRLEGILKYRRLRSAWGKIQRKEIDGQ